MCLGVMWILQAALNIALRLYCKFSFYTLKHFMNCLSSFRWDVLVVDEAHQLKTQRSDRTKSMKLVPARMRVALTGTPMENSVEELRSVLAFVTDGHHTEFSKLRDFERLDAPPSPCAERRGS